VSKLHFTGINHCRNYSNACLNHIRACYYRIRACQIHTASGNRTMCVEINFVSVEITLARALIAFMSVEITLRVEITLCV
jgi:hypothetical protein